MNTLIAAVPTVAPDETQLLAHERSIYGVALVFGARGVSSAGPTIFESGSLTVPTDVSRVKLLLDHDATDPIGVASSIAVSPSTVAAAFDIGAGPRGDLAIEQATDKRRDGLSVGVSIEAWRLDGDTLIVEAATLQEVSLVSIPAFSDARVMAVSAHREDLLTMSQLTKSPDVEIEVGDTVTAASTDTTSATPVQAPPITASPRQVSRFGLTDLAEWTAGYLTSGASAGGLTAALADVTPVSLGTGTIGEGPNMPQYVGELWEAADVDRPFLDALGVGTLTALKMFGFKWETRPEVGRYAGNKAEIPTNTPRRVRAEWEAQRFAGGWDVDRVFVDLPGGTDFIRDVFVQAVRDYAIKSEAYAVERLIAEGTAVDTAATVGLPELLTLVGQDVSATKGGRISLIQMGSARWGALLGLTEAEVPWWLRAQGSVSLTDVSGTIGGISFGVNPDLPDDTLVAIDRRAVKAQEVSPIRVQALDIPRGGVDLGVFGYLAVGVTDSRLVRVYGPGTP